MTISLADGITLPTGQVNASAGGVTGILPVGNGGTGVSNTSNTSITLSGNTPLRFNTDPAGSNITLPSSGTMVATDSGGNLTITGRYITTVAQGNAPIVTGSNTVVANLNVSLLQGGNWVAPNSNLGTTTAVPQANITAINLNAVSLLPAVFDRVVRTAGDITTTSTSLVDVTGATVTFTTGARPVAVGATCTVGINGLASSVWLNIDVDGALQLGTAGLRAYEPVTDNSFNMSFSHQTAALTAAAHTLKMQWKVDANTGTIAAGTATNFGYWAHEIR